MVILPGTRLHKLSTSLPAVDQTVFEPLANAVNWVDLAGVGPGDTVVVEGPGHQGLCVLDAALAAGASTVIVTGAAGDGLRLDAARAIGAHHVIDVSDVDPVERVRELTGGAGADVVMDISPAPATVTTAIDLVRFRGRILLAGLKHFAPIPNFVSDLVVVRGLQVTGGSGFTPESMAAAVDLLEQGALMQKSCGASRSASMTSTPRSVCWRAPTRRAMQYGSASCTGDAYRHRTSTARTAARAQAVSSSELSIDSSSLMSRRASVARSRSDSWCSNRSSWAMYSLIRMSRRRRPALVSRTETTRRSSARVVRSMSPARSSRSSRCDTPAGLRTSEAASSEGVRT
jgi:hypothetical protein